MRHITSEILGLSLFAPINIYSSSSSDLEWGDAIQLKKSKDAEILLLIGNIQKGSDKLSVSLTINELDSSGDVFLSDDLWVVYGDNNAEILTELKKQNFNDLGAYSYLFTD